MPYGERVILSKKLQRMGILIYIRKDEVAHLQRVGLGHFILGKTCHGKKYAEEDKLVIDALRKYNNGRLVED